MTTEEREASSAESPSVWVEVRDTVQAVLIAVILALLVRQFVVETYRVDGPSMEPTLYTGERLLVNKLAYRFGQPRPGQIVVFKPPVPSVDDYVKRVIAVGGQTVSMKDGTVYVNGVVQREPYLPAAWHDQCTMAPVKVPAGDVWVMGDHRADSQDSRYFYEQGQFASVSSIAGRAVLVWWPLSHARILNGQSPPPNAGSPPPTFTAPPMICQQ